MPSPTSTALHPLDNTFKQYGNAKKKKEVWAVGDGDKENIDPALNYVVVTSPESRDNNAEGSNLFRHFCGLSEYLSFDNNSSYENLTIDRDTCKKKSLKSNKITFNPRLQNRASLNKNASAEHHQMMRSVMFMEDETSSSCCDELNRSKSLDEAEEEDDDKYNTLPSRLIISKVFSEKQKQQPEMITDVYDDYLMDLCGNLPEFTQYSNYQRASNMSRKTSTDRSVRIDICYDSDTNDKRVRRKKASLPHYVANTCTKKTNNRHMSSRSEIIEKMKHIKMNLIWHPGATNDLKPNRPPMNIICWIEMGAMLSTTLIQPKLMWAGAYQHRLSKKQINGTTEHIDLLDICRVFELDESSSSKTIDKEEFPFVRSQYCFVITTVENEKLVFEVRDPVERRHIVTGFKLIISDLAAKVAAGSNYYDFFTPSGSIDSSWQEDEDEVIEERDSFIQDDRIEQSNFPTNAVAEATQSNDIDKSVIEDSEYDSDLKTYTAWLDEAELELILAE